MKGHAAAPITPCSTQRGLRSSPAAICGNKTHSGVIGAFGLHVVKTGLVPKDVGRAINEVHGIRLVADYLPQEVPRDRAEWAVQQAPAFIDSVSRIPAVSEAMQPGSRG